MYIVSCCTDKKICMSDNGTNERCPFGLKLLQILCARTGLNKQELSFTLIYMQHKKIDQ